jgi:hypothetical protein
MNLSTAKMALDKIIKKARVHLYKPLQVAEILYHDRVCRDVTLSDLTTYRTQSRRWRDDVCDRFLGRSSTSSARYQDDVFNENATPPDALVALGEKNRAGNGIVEAYIYRCFERRYSQMSSALAYCENNGKATFQLNDFIDLFRREPGLRRSIDKIYEIVVYALFAALVEKMCVRVRVSLDPSKTAILREFDDFATKVLGIDTTHPTLEMPARFHRVGVTNAADRGLDMWANYGPAVQIKHLTLDEGLAEGITSTVTADRIVIVCKDSEQRVILSLLGQLGWRSRIQSVITQSDLGRWYEKALRGAFADEVGGPLLSYLQDEIKAEFPSCGGEDLHGFMQQREYNRLQDVAWTLPVEEPE